MKAPTPTFVAELTAFRQCLTPPSRYTDPRDLPVQAPTKYQLVVDLKTAKSQRHCWLALTEVIQ
jgi:hypothetical protein